MGKAAVTATLNLDTKEWTRELTKGKEQLRAFQSGIAAIKLKPLKMPEFERAPSNNQWSHLEGQWAQIRKSAETSMRGVEKASRGGGQAILVLGQIADDAQYGFRAISGQIPQLVQSLGGSAGLAGAVGLAATSFYLLGRSWNYLQEQLGNKESEEQAATRARKLEAQAVESRRRIDAAIQAYREARGESLTKIEEGGMDRLDRELARTQRLAEAQAELEKARIAAHSGPAAAAEETARRQKAEEASITRQIVLLQEKEQIESARVKESESRIKAMQAELATFGKSTHITEGIGGSRQTITDYSPQYRDRAKQIEAQIAIEREQLDRRAGRRDEASRQRGDLTFTRDQVLPVKRAAEDQDRTNEEAADRAKKTNQKVRTAFHTFQQWADDLLEIGKLMKAQADREKARAQQRAATAEDAAIAHQRARGHTSRADRMQRESDRKRRVKALIENEGFTPEAAAGIARQEERDKRGTTGQKIPRGPANPTGLDGFDFRPRSQRPETPNVEDTRRANTRRFREKEQEAGKGGGIETIVTTLKELGTTLGQKLEELKNATRSPVANGVKPVNG